MCGVKEIRRKEKEIFNEKDGFHDLKKYTFELEYLIKEFMQESDSAFSLVD